MTIPIIVLEGPDGAGKTEHARRLAGALSREGYAVIQWHHPAPEGDHARTLWTRALHYAYERSRLMGYVAQLEARRPAVAAYGDIIPQGVNWHGEWLAGDRPRVVVADRWHWSTLLVSIPLEAEPDTQTTGASLRSLFTAERRAIGVPTVTIHLTAPADAIVERLTARGEDVSRARVVENVIDYAQEAETRGWPTVDTTAPVDDAARAILDHTLKTLASLAEVREAT